MKYVNFLLIKSVLQEIILHKIQTISLSNNLYNTLGWGLSFKR
jgi:hypothetical protein